ncbi:hypothetical protein N203_02980 [Helicobacter pylori UM084]|nr:hypothetical protein N203_02980 [Helicobacter pylori UM084]
MLKEKKKNQKKELLIKRDKLNERAIRLVVARFSLKKVFNFFY